MAAEGFWCLDLAVKRSSPGSGEENVREKKALNPKPYKP